MHRAVIIQLLTLVLTAPLHAADYDPSWAAIAPLRTLALTPPAESDPLENGSALVKAVADLLPGDCLEIGTGTYSVNRLWDITVSGTATAPIWIVAAYEAQVVITRPDARQNILNVGTSRPVSYLCLRGLEFTGGSHGLRLGQCRQVWVDSCHIHHTGEVCLSANTANTSHLYLTRNHIHHGSGHAEGMYLGGNNGDVIMSESVIALNHIHDCRGDQGDGIEVKQGSWGNLIAENHVHDTNYPCITVYGTNGMPVNIIEKNLCYNSGDNVMQVQGEAIVRNNILINGAGAGFASTDHQGKTRNLQVVHNTIINTTHAFRASSWDSREGMRLANNILYSREGNAVHFPAGSSGVTITGNISVGGGPKAGCSPGRGLEDFKSLSWDASRHDATPSAAAPFDHADLRHLIDTDHHSKPRDGARTSGAIAR